LRNLDHLPRDFDIDFDLDARVLTPYGELDMVTTPILLAAVKAFTHEIPGDVTIDFAGVTFGDTALVNALIEIREDQHEQGQTMTIVNATATILRLFLLTGFRTSA
jgi:anti-anti-sigma factor